MERRCDGQAMPGQCTVASAPGWRFPAPLARLETQRPSTCLHAARAPPITDGVLSRAQRARYRLCWQERLARNARLSTAGSVTIRMFGVPDAFAALLRLRAS